MNGFSSIEIHAHFIPPAYKKALIDTGMVEQDRFPVPPWDAEKHLEYMNVMNIDASVVSLSSPHVYFDNKMKTRELFREINEAGARLIQNYPKKFGYFASIPIPDIEGALRELDYAYNVLKVDGIKLITNAKGLYLGEAALDPVFEVLNQHKALLYIHPTMPSSVPENVLTGYPAPMMEFLFDTARAVTNLVLNGAVERYPDIKIIVPHAGGVLPVLVPRIHGILKVVREPIDRPDVFRAFRNLYYDTAGPSIMQQLLPLLNITDDTHLVYGSDWPFSPTSECKQWQKILMDTDQLTGIQKRKIFHDNALELLPRFKTGLKAAL
jgi:predicted TIM-barrel fold metal-dependent hydrolase